MKKLKNNDSVSHFSDSEYKRYSLVNNIEDTVEILFTFRYYIRIYPCPIVNNARFLIYGYEYMDKDNIILRIYDINGNCVQDITKEVHKSSFDGRKLDFRVDLSFLSKGVYIVELISNDKSTTQKMIKL